MPRPRAAAPAAAAAAGTAGADASCRALHRPSLQVVKLKAFSKFQNTTEALAAATALVDSKLDKGAHAVAGGQIRAAAGGRSRRCCGLV